MSLVRRGGSWGERQDARLLRRRWRRAVRVEGDQAAGQGLLAVCTQARCADLYTAYPLSTMPARNASPAHPDRLTPLPHTPPPPGAAPPGAARPEGPRHAAAAAGGAAKGGSQGGLLLGGKGKAGTEYSSICQVRCQCHRAQDMG